MSIEVETEQHSHSYAIAHGFVVSDAMLMAIGLTIVCQSHLEGQLAQQIGKLLGSEPQKVYAITAGMSFKLLSASLYSLVINAIDKSDPRVGEVDRCIKELNGFEEFRNKLAHSMWSHGPNWEPHIGSRFKTTSRLGAGVKHQQEDIDIVEVTKQVWAANQALTSLVLLIADISGVVIPTLESPARHSHSSGGTP